MSSTESETLEQQVEALRAELNETRETLLKENAELKKRVVDLEDQLDGAGGAVDGTFDQHDATVLDLLDGREGEVFTGRQIIKLYQGHTGIRRKDTLKRRAKDLIQSPVFESFGGGRGRFLGGDGDGS